MSTFAATAKAAAVLRDNRSVSHLPPPGGKQARYQTLLSVNNLVTPETFKSDDKDSFLKYWDAVFLSNTSSEDNYNAIASMSTTATAVAQAEKIQWTEIHWDFVLDKANLTPTELQNRYLALNGRLGLSKDDTTAGDLPELEDGCTPMADFEIRVNNLRLFICNLVRPRMNRAFVFRAKALNHGYDHCVTLEDFLREVRTGPYDNKKRALVFQLCNKLWGKECSGDIEEMVMAKLRLKYKNELVDGKDRVPKTRRTHGSIRKMINRMKQTNYVERFRDICREVWKEIPYLRELKTPQKGVVKVIKANVADHGFEGYLGLCAGHKDLEEQPVSAPVQPSLYEFLKKQKEEGNGSKSLDDILAVWDASSSPKTAAPKVTPTVTPASEKAIVAVPGGECLALPNPMTSPTLPNPMTPPITEKPAPPPTLPNPIPEKPAPKARNPKPAPTKNATTPETPTKRKVESLAPGAKSPDRMRNGNFCYGCDHGDLVEYGRPHFNPKLCAQDNYPKACSGCKRSLLNGKDKSRHCHIQGIWSVHCCRNAMNHRDHNCVYVLCHDCWVPKSPVKEPSTKKQRTSRRERRMALQLFPGERQLTDGRVIAD